MRSPKSLHKYHTVALENEILKDENGKLKEGMEQKNYVDGSIYIG